MLYNLGTYILALFLRFFSLFNKKAKTGNTGRAETLEILKNKYDGKSPVIWFHCASLGEYEQGLPVFKILRERYPKHFIVLSFFSPSGFITRKNSPIADAVVYLPVDTPQNAKHFVKLLKPQLAVFVKYEIWANYLLELNRINCKTYLISALFRKDQIYFKWYGSKLKQALKSFELIFVQDNNSKQLLNNIGYKAAVIAEDTRLDRVFQQLEQDNTLDWLADFKQNDLLLVFGSTWPEDEKYIVKFINENSFQNLKFLVVPHEIKESHLNELQKSIELPSIRFTNSDKGRTEASVMILDAIGYLSRTYAYADIAYVGGAVGKSGLHNILEPAVFGIPIIIGNNYKRFPEAIKLTDFGGIIPIKNYAELSDNYFQLIQDENTRIKIGNVNEKYIKNNKGAVIQITDIIRI
ncbi:3-deoxy-D-manno-octulosonic-acid transferase [Flavobacteriaceae bacterium MAR_2010_188]|nr:3-deoxy-D-manno-octulosonic-acid transferase [Flavobacteriaceae bacterium MAR_2010_188]